MRVALAADHAGLPLKEKIAVLMQESDLEVLDLGTNSAEPADYPDFAEAIGEAIQKGKAKRGILICGSGVGACVAANHWVAPT